MTITANTIQTKGMLHTTNSATEGKPMQPRSSCVGCMHVQMAEAWRCWALDALATHAQPGTGTTPLRRPLTCQRHCVSHEHSDTACDKGTILVQRGSHTHLLASPDVCWLAHVCCNCVGKPSANVHCALSTGKTPAPKPNVIVARWPRSWL